MSETKPGDGGTVVIRAHEFRLPEVLRHIEAGRIVRVVLPARRCEECRYLLDSLGHLTECRRKTGGRQ